MPRDIEAYRAGLVRGGLPIPPTGPACVEHPNVPRGDGYIEFVHAGVRHGAHRYALEFKLGRQVREGYDTCHTCDNPRCWNQDHLFEGTRSDNVRDMLAKGRGRCQGRNTVIAQSSLLIPA